MKPAIPKLSSYSLPWPTDWSALFQRAVDTLILEIGFGYGQYLRHLSRTHPDANIIGLEINSVSLVKAENAIARGDLPNVRVIYSRAETALHHLIEPAALDQIHINFPDPWFKTGHSHRRLIQRDTVDVMVSRLKVGGMLYLATDILEYAEMSAAVFADTPGLTNTLPTPWVNELPGRAVTKYEARAQREGRDRCYFALRRNETPAPVIPVQKEREMPHMVIQTPLTLDAIWRQFEKHDFTEGETSVNFLHAFLGQQAVLFETYIHEPTIDQRAALVLVEPEPAPNAALHEYTLRLSLIGSPRPTDGMHLAVARLGMWILALHPENRTIQHKLRA